MEIDKVIDQNIKYLRTTLQPLGYQLDLSQEKPIFWKNIPHQDLQHRYAFSLVMVTLDHHTYLIEGLNEPLLRRAIRAGVIEVSSEEDVDALKDIVFEGVFEDRKRLERILDFFERQLDTLTQYPIESDEYKKALSNIALLVEAANDIA